MEFIRRDFIRLMLVGIGGSGLLGRRGRVYALAHAQENPGAVAPDCRFFNTGQVRTLEALCERLIPADDVAGAKDARVVYFIDRAVTSWAVANRWDYVVGLEGVDESSQALFGRAFVSLAAEQQDKVLEAMETGEAPGLTWTRLQIGAAGRHSSANFFDLLLTHTMQGFYAHPKYGGNKDMVSWKMLKYSGLYHV